MKRWLTVKIAGLILERPARKRSLAEHGEHLNQAGGGILDYLARARDSERNRAQLGHIIGIERWGQQRLRALLGEPLVIDEYDAYRPASDTVWEALVVLFRVTREETLDIVDALASSGIDLSATVPHNQYGPLTARGWLRYLDIHANAEVRRIK